MTLAPWYFLTFWLAPAPTEPVLVPFQSAKACYTYETERVAAWMAYIERNRAAWKSDDPNFGYFSWASQPASLGFDGVPIADRLTFRVHAGPISVSGQCIRGSQLSPESLKALATSP